MANERENANDLDICKVFIIMKTYCDINESCEDEPDCNVFRSVKVMTNEKNFRKPSQHGPFHWFNDEPKPIAMPPIGRMCRYIFINRIKLIQKNMEKFKLWFGPSGKDFSRDKWPLDHPFIGVDDPFIYFIFLNIFEHAFGPNNGKWTLEKRY